MAGKGCAFPRGLQKISGNPVTSAKLQPRDLPILLEAGAALAAASLVTRLLPFRRYIALGSRRMAGRSAKDGERESWLVDRLAERVPFRAVCLQRGLALQWMLRRRNIDAVLHYGVRKTGEQLDAHVWVSVEGRIVIGSPVPDEFREVARYPAA